MHILKSLPMMSLPFIPVVDVSAAERWRALDFRWSQDARSDAGVQQGDKATICNDKGEITGDMSWKNRRTTGDFGETKMAGKCFCQVWPDLSFQESMFFFWGGATFWLRHFNTIWGWPSLLVLFGENGIYNQQIWLRIYAPSAPWLW